MPNVVCMQDGNGNVYATYMKEESINKLDKVIEKKEITLKELRKMFIYNPETGDLIYRDPPRKKKIYFPNADGKAGYANSKGYKHVSIRGKVYSVHRLIWYIYYGKKPNKDIDHINRDPSDNRIINLRLVTKQQNCLNRSVSKNSVSGVIGVSWNKQRNKWQAGITINKKHILLGIFLNFEDAVKARKSAEDFAGITKFKFPLNKV